MNLDLELDLDLDLDRAGRHPYWLIQCFVTKKRVSVSASEYLGDTLLTYQLSEVVNVEL